MTRIRQDQSDIVSEIRDAEVTGTAPGRAGRSLGGYADGLLDVDSPRDDGITQRPPRHMTPPGDGLELDIAHHPFLQALQVHGLHELEVYPVASTEPGE